MEGIQKQNNFQLSFDLFKQVAWPSGVPEIIVDLIVYLVGGCGQEVRETLKRLQDRVKPTVYYKNGSIEE